MTTLRIALLPLSLLLVSPVPAQDKSTAAAAPVCSAEIRWTNCDETRNLTRNDVPLNLNLFCAASKPEICLPAEIRLAATFYDLDNNVICSGVVDAVVTQTTNVQSVNLEIRPYNSIEFVRWRNGPRPTAVRPKRLFCINADGLAEIPSSEIERAVQIRLDAAVLPRNGGLSTASCKLNLQP